MKFSLLFVVVFMFLSCSTSFADPVPMQARQSVFNLEFKVYRTSNMPANWFKTYDDYFVTKRIDNNWVYGKQTINGMEITDILVGTVDPTTVHELNETNVRVIIGATPVYMPPLPPEIQEIPYNINISRNYQSSSAIINERGNRKLSNTANIFPKTNVISQIDYLPPVENFVDSLSFNNENEIPPIPPITKTKKNYNVFELAKRGTPAELREAVKAGANFNVEIDDEFSNDFEFGEHETPLHRAAFYNNNPKSIKFLISLGLDVNALAINGAAGRYNDTPLSLAIKRSNLEVVKVLLQAGADPNEYCSEGMPVNMFLLTSRLDTNTVAKKIINMLVKAKGNINIHYDIKNETDKNIIEHVKDIPNELKSIGFLSQVSQQYLESSRTALISSVIDDNPNAVNLLLDAGADPNIKDLLNKTALDYAKELPSNSKIKRSPVFHRLELNNKNKRSK